MLEFTKLQELPLLQLAPKGKIRVPNIRKSSLIFLFNDKFRLILKEFLVRVTENRHLF